MTPFDQQQGQMQMPPQQQGPQQGPGMQMPQPPQPQQQPQQQPSPREEDDDPQQFALKSRLDAMIETKNLAEKQKPDKLKKIGMEVVESYEKDLNSCRPWLDANSEWLDMALLTRKTKTFPWPGASNVKYPLLSTAAMQFSARAYPTLVPADNQIVKSRVIGYDPDGSQADKADRIAKHMSYQIMHEMPAWEEDMDRLLMITSICGVCFKKTYKDSKLGKVVSELIYPENLIVNYWAKSLEEAFRKTELVYLTKNEIQEKYNSEEFLEIPNLGSPSVAELQQTPMGQKAKASTNYPTSLEDDATPHLFLAQHTFYDLDGDDYAEPVVITVHKATKFVVRITARFASDSIEMSTGKGKKKVLSIKPLEYFTDFQFLPNPDGSIYGMGFGTLLGPINESVNTICNQLVDAGHLNNLQSGFIAKGLRIQMKETRFIPGEWKSVNATGDDLKNSIFPLPVKEPSSTLMELMQLLIQAGNQLASVAEIFVGKMPGQNTPATTTQETVDQAMKVFTAIYKRLYRALLREFQKIFRINSLSPDILEEESEVLNIPLQVSDYEGMHNFIIPAADPSGNSAQTQFSQLQQVGQTLLPLGVLNNQEYAMRNLKLIQIPDPEKLINTQPPPPDPKVQTEQIKQQTMQQQGQIDAQAKQMDMQLKQQDMQLKKQMAELDRQMEELKLQFKQRELEMDLHMQGQKHQLDMVQTSNEMQMDQQVHQMESAREMEAHQLEMNKQKEMASLEVQNAKKMGSVKVDQATQMGKIKQKQAAKPKPQPAK